MTRLKEFIYQTQEAVTNFLGMADDWSGYQVEYSTFSTNGITITDADVADLGLTAAQFMAGLSAMQQVVDYAHVSTRAAQLYRIKK